MSAVIEANPLVTLYGSPIDLFLAAQYRIAGIDTIIPAALYAENLGITNTAVRLFSVIRVCVSSVCLETAAITVLSPTYKMYSVNDADKVVII
jgi:hypothetical protein